MVEKFAKVFNMKIAPMLLLMTQKHQTSQARYLQFQTLLVLVKSAKNKFVLTKDRVTLLFYQIEPFKYGVSLILPSSIARNSYAPYAKKNF